MPETHTINVVDSFPNYSKVRVAIFITVAWRCGATWGRKGNFCSLSLRRIYFLFFCNSDSDWLFPHKSIFVWILYPIHSNKLTNCRFEFLCISLKSSTFCGNGVHDVNSDKGIKLTQWHMLCSSELFTANSCILTNAQIKPTAECAEWWVIHPGGFILWSLPTSPGITIRQAAHHSYISVFYSTTTCQNLIDVLNKHYISLSKLEERCHGVLIVKQLIRVSFWSLPK